MRTRLLLLLTLLAGSSLWAANQPEFSTAGFYELENTGRTVYSMNPAWRFHKGAVQGAEAAVFDDKDWTVVSLPNGIEYLPTEASGCINYQGEVWYSNHFVPAAALKWKKLFLHFDAIPGKSKVYVNGELLAEHFGGYLPVVVDVTDALHWDSDNVIAVWADNSDDPIYPPGKPQDVLDFTYCGGIYRDCWLVAHNHIFITNPNYENEVAGGGLFVSFGKVSEDVSEVNLKLHVRNETAKSFEGKIEYVLLQRDGKQVAQSERAVRIKAGKAVTSEDQIKVTQPQLWTPSTPYLYNLLVRIYDASGNVVDGYRHRLGIRSIEFKGKDGFWLNGKPYGKPLIGGNRHQDYAVVGNAVANSAHWRDAKKLKEAGMEVIRNAHCPQDPAFMDACDELGLLMIDNTPGWQFWNNDPIFAARVYNDIRNLVRRDRNHACIWLWEPILNETEFPADFAKTAHDTVDEEYPYPYCYSGCDSWSLGHEYFPVLFSSPFTMRFMGEEFDPSKTYFTREWGDNVDDWSSHNSPSRVARNWGEEPMRIQARHYAKPDYDRTNYDVFFQQPPQHVGGALWHSFDHQRGYHPDPFYGGLMDVFRQPKYSYYMFMAQRPAEKTEYVGNGPMVYIAHEMTPFSGKDVTVYSNCDEVRLTFNEGGEPHIYKKDKTRVGMPSPIIVFEDVYDFMEDQARSMRGNRQDEVYLLAEGLIDGEVVATHKVTPARRPEQILLWVDNEGTDLIADGSDFVTIVAAVADKNGSIKHLNNYFISFTVEGEGHLLGDSDVMANPAPVKWGTAPFLLQSTLTPGKIRVTAKVLFEGSQMPISGTLELESKPAVMPMIYDEKEAVGMNESGLSRGNGETKTQVELEQEVERLRKELNTLRLKEVEQQQTDFGEKLPVVAPSTPAADYAKGADLSWVTEMEEAGVKFYDADGNERECFELMKSLGMNSVRLRVWVNPKKGWCNKEDVVVKAVRAKNLGMRVMIDFHYSDFWADPSSQYKPAAWEGLSLEELKAAITAHTTDVLNALLENGVEPEWVQVGNEVRPGMLWDSDPSISGAAIDVNSRRGTYSPNQKNFADFITTGYDAVKSVFPNAKVIVHIDNGYDSELFRWIFDLLTSYNAKYDVIGMSLYPDESNWQDRSAKCIANVKDMINTYGKEVVLCEVGMEYYSAPAAKAWLTELISESKAIDGCLGVFYWEPQCYKSWNGYDKGAFGNDGRPTEALDPFKD